MPVIPYSNRLEPANDAAIWRFMDLRKFRDLMASEELYFRRADLFTDKRVEKGLLFALKRRADRNLGSRRAFLSGKVVSAVSFHRKRTAENYRRGYSLRSATLGSTAAALRAGK